MKEELYAPPFRPSKKSSESWAFMHIDGKIEEKRERREQRC